MGLFKKEFCCLCNGKVGLLDKKCIDGKVCKTCREYLSVWFDDYKNSTKSDLAMQHACKVLDETKAASTNFNRIYGEAGVILISEADRVFTAFPHTSTGLFGSNKQVSSIADVMEFHPDLISFDSVEDFDIDINEISNEEKRTENGAQVSYNPPRYIYSYEFTLRLKINHDYIKSIYIPLNATAVRIHSIGRRVWTDPGHKLSTHLNNLPAIEDRAAVYNNDSLLKSLLHSKYEMPDMSFGFRCTNENWDDLLKYRYYLSMAREIQSVITGTNA